MRKRFISATLSIVLSTTIAHAADKSPKSPLPPRVALKQFVLHPKLKVELVACEPQVVDPVAIRFDEDGRLWVVEMRDYPNGPRPAGFKKADKARRQRPAGLSRIRVLRDKNRDGFYETATTFADNLLFATGLQPWKGGLIVTLAGEVAYFKDTNGDDKADVRETWFTGFAEKNPQLRANHPTFALDNHIYIANGLRGGDVIARKKEWAKNAKPISISGMDFRFDPRTGKYEAVSGHGQFGLTFDDFGNRFVCSNRNPCRHVVLENRYLKRNPHLAVPSVMHDVSPAGADSRVYPISRTWTTSTLHAGQFTAACGVTIYRGDALPKEFQGNSFTCEPTGNLVHRDVLKPQGATFTSKPGRKGIEFLATKDEWFRPVNLANGPDGALYVVDMYRAVIEHPQWVPDELKNRPDARLGDDRGRIYRIMSKEPFSRDPKGSAASIAAKHPQLSEASTAELVTLLEHPNAWHRTTASRLLYERQDKAAGKPLKALLIDIDKPQTARVHALWALAGIGGFELQLTRDLTQGESRRRRILVNRRPRRVAPRSRLAEQLLLVVEASNLTYSPRSLRDFHIFDLDLRGDFQWLLTAGAAPRKESPISNVSVTPVKGPWMRWAYANAVAGVEEALMGYTIILFTTNSVKSYWHSDEGLPLFQMLAEAVGSRGRWNDTTATLRQLNALNPKNAYPRYRQWAFEMRLAGMLGLSAGFSRRGKDFYKAISRLPNAERAKVAAFFAQVIKQVESTKLPTDQRLRGMPLLQHAETRQAVPVLTKLALTESNRRVRIKAIGLLDSFYPGKADKQLLAKFKTETPEVKRAILDLFVSNDTGFAAKARMTLLLDAIAAKRIPINELDPARVRRLTRYRDKTIRDRAKKLLAAAIPADRKKVLAEYQEALTLKADAKRGRAIFKKNCATCHRIGDIGVNVAPDIGDSRTKTPAQLLTSILDPNRAIDNNYISYTVVLKTGKVQTGIIATETSSSITLQQPENKRLTLLRRDIEVLKSNGVSLMPVGLEKNITVQQMADLVSFIKNWRYLDGRVPLSPRKKE